MLKSILGRKKEEISEADSAHALLVEKISKMNLTEMRSYVKNKMKEYKVSEDGLNEVMHRLIKKDKKSKKYYLQVDDMDSKKKKAFDLVITIAQNKRTTLVTIELIQKFTQIYKNIIEKYDREHKEIYVARFSDAINTALVNISQKVALKKKLNLIGD